MEDCLRIAPVLFLFVVLAACTDLRSRRIPNVLVLVGLCCAMTLHLLSGNAWSPLMMGLGGAAAGLGLFLPLYVIRGMAAGDVKLMAMVGSFVGPVLALKIGMVTFMIGGLMGLGVIAWNGLAGQAASKAVSLLRPLLARWTGRPAPARDVAPASLGKLPYGLAIALGTIGTIGWLSR
jgi:prepilin peptidase CpaA